MHRFLRLGEHEPGGHGLCLVAHAEVLGCPIGTLLTEKQDAQTSMGAHASGRRVSRGLATSIDTDQSRWPRIEAFRVADKFVVQADRPGMQAHNIVVEITETDLIVAGERVGSTRGDGQTYQQERCSS
jgi:HSP20 family molecular chaperone IbpA